jgi:hypothetical protein
MAFRILDRIAAGLMKKDPGTFAALPALIDDLRLWIEGDLNDPDFLMLDEKFRTQHDGFTAPGYQYRIRIPETKPIDGTDNPYLKREEFIRGSTWNRWQAPENEKREVVSLLAKSLFQQFSLGQVHSDVHPGNIIVTPERELAIIDRHHYLLLNPTEKTIIQGLFTTLAGASCEELVRALDPEVQPGAPLIGRLDKTLAEMRDRGLPNGTMAGRIVQLLQKSEIRLPINVTLMVKNLLALNRMAQQAGFADAQEAVLYQPNT